MKISRKIDFVKSPLGRPDIGIWLRPGRKKHRAINAAYPHYFQLVALAVFDHHFLKINGIQDSSKLPSCRSGLEREKNKQFGEVSGRVCREQVVVGTILADSSSPQLQPVPGTIRRQSSPQPASPSFLC